VHVTMCQLHKAQGGKRMPYLAERRQQ
jgi:hypothetical protein